VDLVDLVDQPVFSARTTMRHLASVFSSFLLANTCPNTLRLFPSGYMYLQSRLILKNAYCTVVIMTDQLINPVTLASADITYTYDLKLSIANFVILLVVCC